MSGVAKIVTRNLSVSTAKAAIKNTSKLTAKEILENTNKKFLKESAKKSIDQSIKQSAKESVETASKNSLKILSKITTKKLAIAGGTALASGYVGKSLLDYSQINNKKFNITSIVDASDMFNNFTPSAILTFTEPQKISNNDKVELSETDSYPPLDGLFNIIEVINENSIKIQISEKLTNNGTKGFMILKTTFENQLSNNLQDTTKTVKTGVSNIFETLGISFDDLKLYSIIFIVVFLILSLSSIVLKFT